MALVVRKRVECPQEVADVGCAVNCTDWMNLVVENLHHIFEKCNLFCQRSLSQVVLKMSLKLLLCGTHKVLGSNILVKR